MAVLDEIVGAFRPARIAGHPSVFAKAGESFHAAGDEFVDVGLMADVPDDPVVGAVERPVQGDGQLDHSQVGAQVTTGPRDLVHQKLADLLAEFDQLGIVQLPQIGGSPDSGEKRRHKHNRLPGVRSEDSRSRTDARRQTPDAEMWRPRSDRSPAIEFEALRQEPLSAIGPNALACVDASRPAYLASGVWRLASQIPASSRSDDASSVCGIRSRNVDPRPSSLSTWTDPPCRSTTWRTMARPKPVPPVALARAVSTR